MTDNENGQLNRAQAAAPNGDPSTLDNRRGYGRDIPGCLPRAAVLILTVTMLLGTVYLLVTRKITVVDDAPFLIAIFFTSWLALTLARSWESEQEQELSSVRARVQQELKLTESAASGNLSYFEQLVTINVTNLAEYYVLVKGHTRTSFLAAMTSGVVGFLFILVALVIGLSDAANADLVAGIVGLAGMVTSFISAVFFYLYSRTVRQLKEYHDSLLQVQNVLLSFKIVGDLTDESQKAQLMGKMIGYLMDRGDGDPGP